LLAEPLANTSPAKVNVANGEKVPPKVVVLRPSLKDIELLIKVAFACTLISSYKDDSFLDKVNFFTLKTT